MSSCLKSSRLVALTSFIAIMAEGVLASPGIAGAQTTVLHSFIGGGAFGPVASPIQATDGNLYGTTYNGGPYDFGTVFKMTSAGTVTVLHTFSGGTTDGAHPYGALVQATGGDIYGTTYSGGASGYGTVFKITLAGAVTILHSFSYTDGGFPQAALIQATDGNLYGTTSSGGASGSGTVFKMTPAGAVTFLHAFDYAIDRSSPETALIQAADGNFYGTTGLGGKIFKMTSAGAVTVLHSLSDGTEGSFPRAALIQASDGNFYGTTYWGGASGKGTVFKLTPSGTLTVLHTFAGGTTDGANAYDALLQATDGSFYGTTFSGGASGYGTAFKMTPDGTFTVLHSFVGGAGDGASPRTALLQGADGNFSGTTYSGGAYGAGTVFSMTPAGTVTVLTSFSSGADGTYAPSALIQATDGNFYGTTSTGGRYNVGTVFKMTSAGTVTVLHAFAGGTTDGASPKAALLQAADGNFYGTTSEGGASGDGTVFKMTPTGTVTVLHSFAGGTSDGANPRAALLRATDGNFYGTTYYGGVSNVGTVFRMAPDGTVGLLHSFAGATYSSMTHPDDGALPEATVIQAADGNFYGTTAAGGTSSQGTLFRMTPGGTVTVLVSFGAISPGSVSPSSLIQATDGNFYGTIAFGGFCGHNTGCGGIFKITAAGTITSLHVFGGGADGAHPRAALIQAADGNFYGTTHDNDLSGGSGTAFMITPGGTLTRLHAFAGGTTDGAFPEAALLQAADGNFYGTTTSGGVYGLGGVFRISAALPTSNLAVKRNDLDRDGKTDLAVFRPSNGVWYVRYSSLNYSTASANAVQWGLLGDVPIAGDFDGDGKIELTVFRPSTGTWYIRYSSLAYSVANAAVFQWGLPEDVPIAGDFDGDGRADLAVYRPSIGGWFIRYSSLAYSVTSFSYYQWGLPGDVPIAGDFDGDGRADLAVWRPSIGGWFIRYSSLGYSLTNFSYYQWGLPGDIPIAGDFDGDGRTDLAVWRPSIGGWFIRYSSLAYAIYSSSYFQWGLPGDVPMSADFDGDGKTELSVFRPSTGEWFIRYSSQNYNVGGFVVYQWGLPGDALVQ